MANPPWAAVGADSVRNDDVMHMGMGANNYCSLLSQVAPLQTEKRYQ